MLTEWCGEQSSVFRDVRNATVHGGDVIKDVASMDEMSAIAGDIVSNGRGF
jgi:hypothetical protein